MEYSYNIKVEKLTTDDVYNHLCESSADFAYPSEKFMHEYAKKLANYADFLTLRDSTGSLQGIIAYYANNGKFAYISHVWIAKCHRGGGYCGELLSRLHGVCHELNLSYIKLEVRKDNTSAITAYRKFGFVTVSENECKSQMQKEIT